MGVPGWLLKIVIGYLTERELIVSYKGEDSERKAMPGGGPQGTVLGMFLFLILINDAGYSKDNEDIGKKITTSMNKRTEMEAKHFKYVDDMTLVEAIKLKETLTSKPGEDWVRPVPFHSRFEHALPIQENKLQYQLSKLKEYTGGK